MKSHPDRNKQFEIIYSKIKNHKSIINPLISVDTKKKEYLGNFYRAGKIYTKEAIEVFDHDFNSFSKGIIIPHGIYDMNKNKGFINIGTSHDTAEFCCDSIKKWWITSGKKEYPNAKYIQWFSDGGGSNSSRSFLFKKELQKLVNKINMPIHVSHYPPYCSKFNSIEHRMFPHVTQACKGVPFYSIKLVKELIKKTKTKQGLSVKVKIINKVYKTGKKVSKNFKKNMEIIFEDFLPQWNYKVIPQGNL